jgi:two-component system CheB/CheR fusion protein
LATANEYLQSLVEENNTVTDALKFVNDEAQSKNEELSCSNEELQTAKEEVESANEELATINEELRSRNNDLSVLSNDLTNLLDSVNLPVVMLSEDLRLRRMTAAAKKILNLISTDIGRPVENFNLVFDGADLTQLATEVIQSGAAKEIEIQN